MKHRHVEVLGVPANAGAPQGCGYYADAPVCTKAEEDVTCTGEIYRGCPVGQTDCADQPGNDDDVCCWGFGPGVGDNIDHENCATADAWFGSTCFWGWDSCEYDGPPQL